MRMLSLFLCSVACGPPPVATTRVHEAPTPTTLDALVARKSSFESQARVVRDHFNGTDYIPEEKQMGVRCRIEDVYAVLDANVRRVRCAVLEGGNASEPETSESSWSANLVEIGGRFMLLPPSLNAELPYEDIRDLPYDDLAAGPGAVFALKVTTWSGGRDGSDQFAVADKSGWCMGYRINERCEARDLDQSCNEMTEFCFDANAGLVGALHRETTFTVEAGSVDRVRLPPSVFPEEEVVIRDQPATDGYAVPLTGCPPTPVAGTLEEVLCARHPAPRRPTERCTPKVTEDPCSGTLAAPDVGAHATRQTLLECATRLLSEEQLGSVLPNGNIRLSSEGQETLVSSLASKKVEELDLALATRGGLVASALLVASVWASSGDPLDQVSRRTASWCSRAKRDEIGLTCLSRLGFQAPLAKAWACADVVHRGVVTKTGLPLIPTSSRDFSQYPIDQRLPEALDEALARLRSGLMKNGVELRGLAVNGCQFPRLERGAALRAALERDPVVIDLGMVSQHTAASACDITGVWVGLPGSTDSLAIWVDMMSVALSRSSPSSKSADLEALLLQWRNRVWRAPGGEGAWFRSQITVELPGDARSRLISTVAIELRNALVDAGFIVLSPATNPVHWNHLHVHLPADPNVWAQLEDDSTPTEARERLISRELRASAGR